MGDGGRSCMVSAYKGCSRMLGGAASDWYEGSFCFEFLCI